MSTAIVSGFYEIGDVVFKNNKHDDLDVFADSRFRNERNRIVGVLPQRRHSTSGTSQLKPPSSLISLTAGMPNKRDRERSLSASVEEERRRNAANSSRYKTELCRPFEENGMCKYGDKCQFAHGYHELRQLSRHPKYKTELCRTFHTIGFCPYGPRCHFIHNAEEKRSAPPQITNGININNIPAPLSPISSGAPSPPLSDISSPIPSNLSLTPPSPPPIQFYDEHCSPASSPLPVPISRSSKTAFSFSPPDYSPVVSPVNVQPSSNFIPIVQNNDNNNIDDYDDSSSSSPDSTDGSPTDRRGRRLPVFNRIAIPE